ncbi:MAG: hypothetical protein PX483_15700 [Nostocales cyanobacterium LE14-WE4]|nr:hypothetical protein [Dolichospermum sp. WA123]MCE2701032.1 hypothetical protein [Anabaena sp. 49633_E8]MDJ0502267.1 hypothetical protein [Nostocales cyanobacterium LE14-WE4]
MSVGAKHLEDKLSVIAKNSSPNASPVQLSVVRCPLFVVSGRKNFPTASPVPSYFVCSNSAFILSNVTFIG